MVTIEQLAGADKFWYMASSFSHSNYHARCARLEKSQQYSAYLMSHGVVNFAPIHATSVCDGKFDLPFEHDFWIRFNKMFIDSCAGILLCDMDGIYQSRGCNQEVRYACDVGLPVYLVTLVINDDASAHYWEFNDIDLPLWESRVIAASPIDKTTKKSI